MLLWLVKPPDVNSRGRKSHQSGHQHLQLQRGSSRQGSAAAPRWWMISPKIASVGGLVRFPYVSFIKSLKSFWNYVYISIYINYIMYIYIYKYKYIYIYTLCVCVPVLLELLGMIVWMKKYEVGDRLKSRSPAFHWTLSGRVSLLATALLRGVKVRIGQEVQETKTAGSSKSIRCTHCIHIHTYTLWLFNIAMENHHF